MNKENRIKARMNKVAFDQNSYDVAVKAYKQDYDKTYTTLKNFLDNCKNNYVKIMNDNPGEDFDFIIEKVQNALTELQELDDQFAEDFFN